MTGKDLARRLERDGWTLSRTRGSHHIYKKAGRKESITIPMHSGRDLKKGLLARVLRITGLRNL